jgi:putative addiction module component (TIGR02574 family)
MARTLDDIRDEVLALEVEERGAVADAIWESFLTDEEREVQAAWIEEAERRIDAMRSGKVKGIPWEQVKAKVLAKLDAESRSSSRR